MVYVAFWTHNTLSKWGGSDGSKGPCLAPSPPGPGTHLLRKWWRVCSEEEPVAVCRWWHKELVPRSRLLPQAALCLLFSSGRWFTSSQPQLPHPQNVDVGLCLVGCWLGFSEAASVSRNLEALPSRWAIVGRMQWQEESHPRCPASFFFF